MTELVRASLLVLAAYGTLGLLFAVVFHRRGLARLDAGAHGAGWGFRLLITPGLVALWPLLARRWQRMARGELFLGQPDAPIPPQRLRAVHALAWKALAVLVPVVVAAALWWRPHDRSAGNLPAALTNAPRVSGIPDAILPANPLRLGRPRLD